MIFQFRHDLDPLDSEILERALEEALALVKKNDALLDFDRHEALEASLRRELIEIATFHGVRDPGTLPDMILARLSDD
jgi:hypothetical protein